MKVLRIAALAVVTLVAVGLGFIFSGIFSVAADDPHWAATRWLLEAARERSIAARAGGITVPPLDDPKLIAIGAEHYSEMCTKCHLAPGIEGSELRRGLYPQPPNLVEHGSDHSIWGLVAFLHKLPELSPEAYRAIVGAEGADEHLHQHGEHHD